MGAEAPARLPLPPADLASRQLPLRRIEGRLYRVHQLACHAVFFGKSALFRFDDPKEQYGVLYASLKPEAALAETLLRQLSRMEISETRLLSRGLAVLSVSSIFCVNLTGSGLRRLSCDNRIADELPYSTSQLWSLALFDHPQKPSGILYRSRHNPQLTCVAVFSTAQHRVRLKQTTALLDPLLKDWTAKLLRRYRLALLPPMG